MNKLEDIIASLIEEVDPQPNREGLRETPARVAKAWMEWTSGYYINPSELLKTFEDGAESYDSLVIVHHIPVISMCEHHLAPIRGYAHVGYLPGEHITGLSKLARVVDAYSRRLQVQERLTVQIADCIQTTLHARGTAVLVRANHGCMDSRGARVHGSSTTTSAMRGLLRSEPSLRQEFLSLCLSADQQRGDL